MNIPDNTTCINLDALDPQQAGLDLARKVVIPMLDRIAQPDDLESVAMAWGASLAIMVGAFARRVGPDGARAVLEVLGVAVDTIEAKSEAAADKPH
jgi:hypothetical protein